MSFEEKFDKIIRQKAEESNFPFDAANWEKASRMIDAERGIVNAAKSGKSATMIAIASVVVLISVLGVVYFTRNSENNEISTENAVENTAPQTSTDLAPAGNVVSEPKISSNTGEVPVVVEGQAQSANVVEQGKHAQFSDPMPLTEKRSANAASAGKSDKAVDNLTAKPARQFAKEANNIEDLKAANNPVEALATESNRQKQPAKQLELKEEPANLVIPGNEKTPASDANQIGSQGSRVNKQAEGTISTEQPGTAEAETLAATKESEMENEQVENLNLISVSSLALQEEEARLPQLALFQRYDEDFYKKGIKYKTHFFNVEAGGTYLLGWDANKDKDAKGFDWFGGFNYGVYLTRKIAIGIGIQAYNIQNISEPFYSTEKTNYGFGSSNTTSVITTKELYYAAVPLKLYYKINRFNQVSIGLNAGYLYKTNSSVETRYTNEQAPVITNTHEVYSSLESMNYMLNVSYRLRLGRRLWINAEGIYGLTDIFRNNEGFKNTQKPSGLRLSLQYTLFDK